MTAPYPQFSPADLERIRLRAQAEEVSRKRRGVWSGGIKVHPYATRPYDWIVEKLAVPPQTLRWSLNDGYASHKWDGDEDPIIKILDAIGGGYDCGVESATGTGKTFIAACIVLWFLACFENSLVITSAPTEKQLLTQIWKEIGALWPRFQRHFPDAQPITGKIRMRKGDEKDTWTAMAFVAGVGADEDAAQHAAGFHRPHMLIVTEDTPGIDPAIMAAFDHTRTDDHNLHLALGNPDHRNDSLHRFCFDEREEPFPNVRHVRISALDHPNIVSGTTVVPGAIGRRRLEARTRAYVRGSRLYESRIRGISPAEAEDALIKYEWLVRAAEHYDDPAYRQGGPAIGVDAAQSEAGDEAAIARGQGACLTEVEAFACPDADALGVRVVLEARDPENPVKAKHVGADEVGVGASVINAGRRMGFRMRGLGGAKRQVPWVDREARPLKKPEGAEDEEQQEYARAIVEVEQFDNQRSQIYWRFREDLRLDLLALPNDPELFRDLIAVTYTTHNGKICVESKENVIKLLKRSPNKGDACVYWNFVRPRRAVPRKAVDEIPERKAEHDTGLERILARHAKKAAVEERRIRRSFRRARRRA